MPEYLEGRMTKAELAASSFALSFGLVIGFGIPVSIGAAILLIHSILLGTDIIGTWSPEGKTGSIIAGAIGAVYGVGLLLGLQWIVTLFKSLPVNIFDALGAVGTPVVLAFAAFPALAVALQHGIRKGIATISVSALVRILIVRFSPLVIGGVSISLNPDGMAMLAGMIMLLIFGAQEKAAEGTNISAFFTDRVARIKHNVWILAVMGALVAAATAMHLVAGDPISLSLMKDAKYTDATLTALARGIGYVPLFGTTAIATGVYGPAGMTLGSR
jgi:hypothetical protein